MSTDNKKREEVDVSYGSNANEGVPTGTIPTTTVTSGESPDVSYAANGGVEAPKSPSQILSYSEYIAEEEKRLQREKDATYTRAAEIRAEAEKTAQVNRERAGVDAQVSYAQNMSGYGSKAESVASMGLTGGGYSDYIDAKAYATQRAEVQSARAREESAMRDAANAEANAKYQADVSYGANISALGKESATYHENEKVKEEQEMRNAFAADISAGNYSSREALQSALDEAGIIDGNVRSQILASWDVWNKGELDTKHSESTATVLANIEAGVYSSREQAEQAARDAGITNENTIAQLGATWDTQNNKETYDAFVADIEAGNYSTKEALEAELDTAGIFGNKRSQILAKWAKWNNGQLDASEMDEENQNNLYADMRSALYNGEKSRDEVDTAREMGVITPEQYQSIQQGYSDQISAQNYFVDSSGFALSPENAANVLKDAEKAMSQGWITSEKYNEIKATYDEHYKSVTVPSDAVTVSGGNGNFTFSVNKTSAKGVAVTDQYILAIAKSVGENKVFGFADTQRIYVYNGGKVYELVQGDNEKKYKRLHHFILGSGTFDAKSYTVSYK